MTADPPPLLTSRTAAELRELIARLQGRLPMVVVYDHPSDVPNAYVARLHVCVPKPAPTTAAVQAVELPRLQQALADLGLVKLLRHPDDDPAILETWL